MKIQVMIRPLAVAAILLAGSGCTTGSSTAGMPNLSEQIAQNINANLSGLRFPIPAIYHVVVDQAKTRLPGPARLELFLFPDQSYRHVAYGGPLSLDQVTDEGQWSFAEGKVTLVSTGYGVVRAGTRSTFLGLWDGLSERGVWPTVADDWAGVQLAPAGYAYDRPITEDESARLKDSIDRTLGRFSPASLSWRFPMTGSAKGERLPDGTMVLFGFDSINIGGAAVKAERVEIRPDFKSVRIFEPWEIRGTLKNGPDLDVLVVVKPSDI